MTYFMWSAASVMGLTTGVHLFLGTADIMSPILAAEELDPVIRGVSLVVWHMITFMLALSIVAMIYLTQRRNRALAAFVMIIQIGFAAIFIIVNIAMFGSLLPMPQWIAFLLSGALMLPSVFTSIGQMPQQIKTI